jgi:hypothetical protein
MGRLGARNSNECNPNLVPARHKGGAGRQQTCRPPGSGFAAMNTCEWRSSGGRFHCQSRTSLSFRQLTTATESPLVGRRESR